MKTLKELNSKWYWRLIKVLWIILIWLMCLSVWIFEYDSFQTYNPKNIEAADLEIKSSWVLKVPERIKETFSEEIIRLSDLPKIITKKDLVINQEKQIAQLLVLAEFVGKKIDRVTICNEFSLGCSYNGTNSAWSYIHDAVYNPNYSTSVITISKTLYSETKDDFNRDYQVANEASLKIDKLKSWKSNWEDFYDFQKSTGKNIDDIIGSKNYLWFIGFLYLAISSVLALACMVIVSVWIQKICYYIILGEFNPKK